MKGLLITQSIPHYRLPIYELLCSNQDDDIDYFIAADDQPKGNSLKVLAKVDLPANSSLNTHWQVFRNFWINGNILWQKGLVKRAISDEYDVVIMTGDVHYLSTWIIAICRRLLGRPTIMWTHGLLRRESGVKFVIRKLFYNLADGLLLYGNRSKKLLIEAGYSDSFLSVVYNSLDYDNQIVIDSKITETELLRQRAGLKLQSGERVLITAGRLTTPKKIDYLIELLPALNQTTLTRLIVIGNGPEMNNLKSLAQTLNIQDKVNFLGECYDEHKLALLMNISDVFVLPGDAGLSVIHGLTYGIPVVTHDNMDTQKPEVEAIQDGINGSFYRAHDKADLLTKIEFWLNQATENRASLKTRCQEIVKSTYNPGHQLHIINTVVREVLRCKS